jgi:hypothetical protein
MEAVFVFFDIREKPAFVLRFKENISKFYSNPKYMVDSE